MKKDDEVNLPNLSPNISLLTVFVVTKIYGE